MSFLGGAFTSSQPARLRAVLNSSVAIAASETVITSLTIPANWLTTTSVILFRCANEQSGTNAATPTFSLRIGPNTLTGAAVASMTGLAGTSALDGVWAGHAVVYTLGSSGTMLGEVCQIKNSSAVAGNMLGVAATVDTTVANLCELTFASGNAANTYTFRCAYIEITK